MLTTMRFLCLTLFLILTTCGFAQVDSYDISSFKTPDYNFTELRFDPSFSYTALDGSSDKNLDLRLNSSYYLETVTRKKISTFRGSLYVTHHRNQNEDNVTRNDADFTLSLTSQNQFFSSLRDL